MRKYSLWWIIFDGLVFIGALINVLAGDADADDYIVLYFTISILVGLIIRQISKYRRK